MTRELTQEESQRYDRQVRVWGAEAQVRLQNSKVLLAGLRGLNVEVAKNLVLMGVNLSLQDDNVVEIEDLGYNFFIKEDDIGENIALVMSRNVQELNSFANVTYESRLLSDIPTIDLMTYDIILYGGWSEEEAIGLNELCRKRSPNIGFFWCGVFGNESWFISDFGSSYSYKEDPPKDQAIKMGASLSLPEVLKVKWANLIGKRCPLSKTYVKCRILAQYRNTNKRYHLYDSDLAGLLFVATEALRLNGLDESTLSSTEPCLHSLSRTDVEELCRVSTSIPIIPCSVLGSFLAQEVVKSISRSGCPSSCVFLFDGNAFEVRSFPNRMNL